MKMHQLELFSALEAASEIGYIGEPISQLDHALQAATWACNNHCSKDVIFACLFHDIGHLLAPEGSAEMDGLGVLRHEDFGADVLLNAGFSKVVAELVRSHVKAKRYLISINPNYREKLSPASLKTLEFQGGLMTPAEQESFAKDPLFKEKVQIRLADDQGKNLAVETLSLEHFKKMFEGEYGD